MYWDPFTKPGGNPITAVPGKRPKFPAMTLAPVLVIVDPAKTPKLDVEPRAQGKAEEGVAGVTMTHPPVGLMTGLSNTT